MTLKKDLAIVAAYKTVLNSPAGKIVIADLVEQAGVLRTSYVEGDVHGTIYNEGARSLVLHILAKLQLKPENIRDFYNENTTYTEEEL